MKKEDGVKLSKRSEEAQGEEKFILSQFKPMCWTSSMIQSSQCERGSPS